LDGQTDGTRDRDEKEEERMNEFKRRSTRILKRKAGASTAGSNQSSALRLEDAHVAGKKKKTKEAEEEAEVVPQGIVLSRVSLTPAILHTILDFLPKAQVLHTATRVCKAWRLVVRSPQFWPALDPSTGIRVKSMVITNSYSFLKLLKNPMFRSIKRLEVPYKVKSGKKLFDQIAKSCPLLEDIWTTDRMKLDDHVLLDIAGLFPHLESIRFHTHYTERLTDAGIASFCRAIGPRLTALSIHDQYFRNKKFSDETMQIIADFCPNLKLLDLALNQFDETSPVSAKGVIALLRGCTTLSTLNLIEANSVGKDAFEFICANPGGLKRVFVAGNEQLEQDETLRVALANTLASFEFSTYLQHRQRIINCRRNWQPETYWM
jgi:hypothetical protein